MPGVNLKMKKHSRRENPTKEEQRWQKQFAVLKKYNREHGHCFVPPKQRGNLRLAKWIAEQQVMKRSGKLRSDRLRLLRQLGFAWDYRDGLWERRFTELKEYRRRHGHCHVPNRSKKYPSLGNWVQFQRVQKRAGRISAKRARRLKQIGFDWVSRGRSLEFRDSTYWETKWERMMFSLAKFKKRYGHCWVSSGPPGNPKLSRWAANQRRLKQQGLLKKNRQRRLEALGFDWKLADSVGPRWERCYFRLQQFHRRFGHSHVPAEWAENPNLGNWVVKTRLLKRKGLLSAKKVRRLNKIGFVWDTTRKRQREHDAMWSKRLAHLVAFHRKYGHWRVATDQRRFHSLRIWMDNQRIKYHRGRLSKNRIRQLEKAGFSWLSDRSQRLSQGD